MHFQWLLLVEETNIYSIFQPPGLEDMNPGMMQPDQQQGMPGYHPSNQGSMQSDMNRQPGTLTF